MVFNIVTWQWVLVIVSSLLLILISPVAKSAKDFFKGSSNEKNPGFWLLTSSLVISWLFAKSITNAANLGLSFGIVGGVAYGVYYFSFLVAGIVLYKLRTNGGFTSIHHFLRSKFGRSAVFVFSILIAFRLMNEVWSNTMVIGAYFGDKGSLAYYFSIVVFTILTSLYTIKGGLRSSLLTDMIQMVLFVVLIVVILGFIFPKPEFTFNSVTNSGSWTLAGGLNLLLVAFIQIFSYPFHDPVMTDRAFITDAKVMLKSFIWAGIIGFICIVLFSLVGVYGKLTGVEGQAPVEVAKLLGIVMMLVINFIMITSAASTLDSTFNSFAKLWVLDIRKMHNPSIKIGRIAIVGILLIGTIPVFIGAEVLSATTVSGTMVLGLMPVFIFWKDEANKHSFHFSVIGCVVIGIVYAIGFDFYNPISGKYGDLLWVNCIGFLLAIILYKIPIFISKINGQGFIKFKR